MVIKRIKTHGVRFSLYLIAFFFLKLAWWLDWKFGSPTIDQIVFHIQNGNEGLADADPKIIRSFFAHVIASPILFAIALYTIQQLSLSKRAFILVQHAEVARTSKTLRLFALLVQLLQNIFNRYLPIGLLAIATIILSYKVALWSHLRNLEVSKFIDLNYIEPQNIIAPKKKPNLVLIYVESLEAGYSDPSLMGSDLLKPLDQVTAKTLSFKSFKQTFGTGWTMAGIVSTQCGIPLKSHTIFDGNALGEKVRSFLPGARCLGDVLASQGYKNVFLGGASLSFSGKGKFLSQHGYSELYGKEEWSSIGKNNFNEWGLYDDELFKQAKIKIDALENTGLPFNLTILTVDTHPPTGYHSPDCNGKSTNDYKGIITCSANLISDFLNHMKRKCSLPCQ